MSKTFDDKATKYSPPSYVQRGLEDYNAKKKEHENRPAPPFAVRANVPLNNDITFKKTTPSWVHLAQEALSRNRHPDFKRMGESDTGLHLRKMGVGEDSWDRKRIASYIDERREPLASSSKLMSTVPDRGEPVMSPGERQTRLYPSRSSNLAKGLPLGDSLEERRQRFFGPNYVTQPDAPQKATALNRVESLVARDQSKPPAMSQIQDRQPPQRGKSVEVIRGTDQARNNVYDDADTSILDRFSPAQLNTLDRTKVPGLVDAVSGLIEDRRVFRSWQDSPTVTENRINHQYMGNMYGSGQKGYVNPVVEAGTTTTTKEGRFAGESVTGGFYDPITGAEYKTRRGAILGLSEDLIGKEIEHKNTMERQNSINQTNLATTRMDADARRYSADKSAEASQSRAKDNTYQMFKDAQEAGQAAAEMLANQGIMDQAQLDNARREGVFQWNADADGMGYDTYEGKAVRVSRDGRVYLKNGQFIGYRR